MNCASNSIKCLKIKYFNHEFSDDDIKKIPQFCYKKPIQPDIIKIDKFWY